MADVARAKRTLITQGQFAVQSEPDAMISTLLGSCVATCIWDETVGVGGMNHILLPSRYDASKQMRVGANDMELLINGLLSAGVNRHRLKAKLFGGARMHQQLVNIGADNVSFATSFLQNEGIPIIATDTGGMYSRTIRFWPANGIVKIRRGEILVDELPNKEKSTQSGSVELF